MRSARRRRMNRLLEDLDLMGLTGSPPFEYLDPSRLCLFAFCLLPLPTMPIPFLEPTRDFLSKSKAKSRTRSRGGGEVEVDAGQQGRRVKKKER